MSESSGGVVHLHLRDELDGDVLRCVREQLAQCVRSEGVVVRLHLDRQADLTADAARSLRAAARALAARGGRLELLGASEQVRRRLCLHEMTDLLADGPALGQQRVVAMAGAPDERERHTR